MFGPNDDAKIARAGILTSTPRRVVRCHSVVKGVTVAIVGIASTLVISRVRRSACLYADSEIRGSRYQSTVPDSPDR